MLQKTSLQGMAFRDVFCKKIPSFIKYHFLIVKKFDKLAQIG